jgi:trimeric autotransporter adhesin
MNIKTLLTSASALTLALSASAFIATPAHADDCLLDTNNDGNADNNVDTDGGANSNGANDRLACGFGAAATGNNSVALGANSTARDDSTAVGSFAAAQGVQSSAFGRQANAVAGGSTAIGYFSSATGVNSSAIGQQSSATGFRSSAFGDRAGASGQSATAIGSGSRATGLETLAVGYGAFSSSLWSTAVGSLSIASGESSAAFGYSAIANGLAATAIGRLAKAGGDSSIALGFGSSAQFDRSIAIGSDTTRIGQIALGDFQNSLTVAGIANGNSKQSGGLKMVTTDAAGNFGVADIPTAGGTFDPTSINNAITALQGVDTGYNTRITALENAPAVMPFDPAPINARLATHDGQIANLDGRAAQRHQHCQGRGCHRARLGPEGDGQRCSRHRRSEYGGGQWCRGGWPGQ